MKKLLVFQSIFFVLISIVTFQNCSNADLKTFDTDSDPINSVSSNTTPNDSSKDLDNEGYVTDFSQLKLKNTTTEYYVTDGKLKVSNSYWIGFSPGTISANSELEIGISGLSTAQCFVEKVSGSKTEFSGTCTKAGKLIVNLSLKQDFNRDIVARREFVVEEIASPSSPQTPRVTYTSLNSTQLSDWGYIGPKTFSATDPRLLPKIVAEISFFAVSNQNLQLKSVTRNFNSTSQCEVTLKDSSINAKTKSYGILCLNSGELILDLEVWGYPFVRYQHKLIVADPSLVWDSLFLPSEGYSGFTFKAHIYNDIANINIDRDYAIDTKEMNYYGSYMEPGLYAPTAEAATKVKAEIISTVDRSDLPGLISCEIRGAAPNLKANGVLSLYCVNAGAVTIRFTYQLLNGLLSKDLKYDLF